ncbi:hypothetical protein ACJX0J_033610, partial [Zea mays]
QATFLKKMHNKIVCFIAFKRIQVGDNKKIHQIFVILLKKHNALKIIGGPTSSQSKEDLPLKKRRPQGSDIF